MPRKAQPRIIRPSGIEQSANEKYFYWYCNVSKIKAFADKKRFADIVKKYGSEEKLFKTYVLRPVQKYLDAGFSQESIREIVSKHNGKLPKLNSISKSIKTPAKKEQKQNINESSVNVEKVKIYPWTGNPDYFRCSPSNIAPIEDASKYTCLYPPKYLDEDCRDCPIYDRCLCKLKFSTEDWKKPNKRTEVKITPINPFGD